MKINRNFARSLFAVEDIEAGEKLTSENVRSIRPGYGLPPKYLKEVIGRTAATKIEKGTPLSWDLIK
jgi:sialic acid synthase SpsE